MSPMADFEFGWAGLLLVMTSGGFGAIGLLPLIGAAPGGITEFVFYSVVLSSVVAILAAATADSYPAL